MPTMKELRKCNYAYEVYDKIPNKKYASKLIEHRLAAGVFSGFHYIGTDASKIILMIEKLSAAQKAYLGIKVEKKVTGWRKWITF